jgi:hypothetical protein
MLKHLVIKSNPVCVVENRHTAKRFTKFRQIVKVERVWFDPTIERIRPIKRVGQGDNFVTAIKQSFGDILS